MNPACKSLDVASIDESVSSHTTVKALNASRAASTPEPLSRAFWSSLDRADLNPSVFETASTAFSTNSAAELDRGLTALAAFCDAAANVPADADICAMAELPLPTVHCSSSRLCSVSRISLCRASYFSFPRSPASSCFFACLSASLSASSFIVVSSICCWSK